MENNDLTTIEDFVPLPYDGTLKSAEKCHWHLWNYLAETGEDKPHIEGINCDCYACHFIETVIDNIIIECCENGDDEEVMNEVRGILDGFCMYCPMDFGVGRHKVTPCLLSSSLYSKWSKLNLGDPEKKQLAKVIRDLPFKDYESELRKCILSEIPYRYLKRN